MKISSKRHDHYSMLIVAFLILGFGGIVAQTLLLRELLVLFSGNELSLGLVIGSWIVSEALGALLAGLWSERRKVDTGVYTWVTLLFSVAFPSSLYLTRVFKTLAGIPLEMAVSIFTVLYASFVLLLPTGFLHGFLFSLSCSLYSRLTGKNGASAGKVYLYETVGTIAGGLAISYLLIPYLHAFQIALGLVVLNGVGCLFLLTSHTDLHSSGDRGGSEEPTQAYYTVRRGERRSDNEGIHMKANWCYRARRAVFICVVTVIVFVALPVALLIRGADSLQTMSIKQAFPGRNLVHYENSFYQNIAVVRTEDQYVFFTDGLPVVTTPVPDIAFVEEFVHFSLSAHPAPETILFLGGGAGGAINEALKYPSIQQIDYVELDPALLRTIGRFETPLTRTELGDPRVHIHYVDGRRFVRETGTRYDVVLLGHSVPSTLQKNRFYTEEFFLLVRRLLTEKGVFAFSLTGSGAYYGPELKAINKSVLRSLTYAFHHQYVVPGETNIVLASLSADILGITPVRVYDRLRAAGVETKLITQAHLTERLQQRKRDWFFATLGDAPASPNRDFLPAAVFHQIAYENLMLAPFMKPIFAGALKISFPVAALFIVLLCCLVFFAGRRSARVGLPFAITTTGFACMVTELMLIFGFQVVYGYVFYEIAILITAFMTGIAAGSLFITSLLRARKQLQLFIFIEAGLILFVLSQVAIFSFLEASAPSLPVTTHILFLALLFSSGVFAGLEFPLATKIFQTTHSVERSVGVLYAADLAGGWIGGLVTGFLLFPVLGLFNTCLLVALLKAGSFAFLLVQQKRGIIR